MEPTTVQASASGDRTARSSVSEDLRPPDPRDGARIHDLIARCAPLDRNSLYCNLLQCSHFAQTCVIAERDGAPVGWVSGYVRPDDPRRLFIWQVAVAPEARGRGLGRRMIREILARDICDRVTHLDTTVTAANASSMTLFHRLAADLDAELNKRVGFDADTHFAGRNPTEHLVEIGPIKSNRSGR